MAFHFKSSNHDEGGGDDFEEMAEINIIPLVDVMLVLLIIFMVAAPLSLSGIAINLPTSTIARSTIDETRVVLTITKDGRYFIDKLEIKSNRLQDQFTSLYEHREKKDLYIRADKQVVYGKVVDAMSSAKLAGVSKISMLTTPPEGAAKNEKI